MAASSRGAPSKHPSSASRGAPACNKTTTAASRLKSISPAEFHMHVSFRPEDLPALAELQKSPRDPDSPKHSTIANDGSPVKKGNSDKSKSSTKSQGSTQSKASRALMQSRVATAASARGGSSRASTNQVYKPVVRMTDKQVDALRQALEVRNVDIIDASETTTDIIHPELKVAKTISLYTTHSKATARSEELDRQWKDRAPILVGKPEQYGAFLAGGYGQNHDDQEETQQECSRFDSQAVHDGDEHDESYHGECGKGGVHSHGAHSHLGEHGHDHPHHQHEHDQSAKSAVAAGAINVMMMFGFCTAYGLIIFTETAHERHRVLGIKMNLATAAVFGLLLAFLSKVPIAVGGPDMNAVLFIALFVDKISLFLREDLKNKYTHGMVLSNNGTTVRQLAGGYSEIEWCYGDHLLQFPSECEDYHERLRATTIFMVTASSLLLATFFIILGSLRLTRYIAYIPTSIVDAFLSCQGYKVFKYALKLCEYDPRIFIPAAAAGVPLYFLKAHHIGNPTIIIPSFVLIPVLLFYALVYASGGDVESARKDNLMFAEVQDEGFWMIWTDGLYNWKAIEFNTLADTWHHLLVMLGVCTLDCLVTALRTTETKIPIKINKHYETNLYGLGNLAAAACGSTAGYMQLKFNVISYGIMHNVKDRRAGILYGLACAMLVFAPIKVVNYMPRLFIGMLMFFGGASFVAEHLWGSKEYLSKVEWIQVILILSIFIWFDILVAVLVGFILCGITFICKYAKLPCMAGRPQRGGHIKSREQHSALLEIALRHLLDSWLLVVRLKGFIFFASVQTIIKHIRQCIEEEDAMGLASYRRLQYVLFDCELLDGLDSTAEKDLQQMAKEFSKKGVRILWTALKESQVDDMIHRGTIRQQIDAFPDMDSAIIYVEGQALSYRRTQQSAWAELHPAFELNQQLKQLRECFEPFSEILRLDIERFGCPWEFVSVAQIQKYKSLLWVPRELHRELFLVHTGAVGLFKDIPGKDGKGDIESPIGVYRHGWFLNREATMRGPTRHYALALEDGELLYWSEHDWCRMNREQPIMASAMIEEAMRQSNADMEKMGQILRAVKNATLEDELTQKTHRFAAAANKREIGSLIHRIEEDEELTPPQELHNRLEGIATAMHLENFGLYVKVPDCEPGALPDLPRLLQMDLQVAFYTYSLPNVSRHTVGSKVRSKNRGIPWERVPHALMYVGLFDILLLQEQRIDFLSEKEFIDIGHEAFMMRLSNKMIVKLYNHLGRKIVDEGGMMARDSLVDALRSELLPGVSEQEVNGIAYTWEDDGSGMISVAEFMGIVSRFCRRHEQDWNLLRGIRDCLGKSVAGHSKQDAKYQAKWLTPEKLAFWSAHRHKKHPHRAVDLHQAEEMLWAAGCHTDLREDQQGKVLEWAGIAAACLVNVDRAHGKLPPQPKSHQDLLDDATSCINAKSARHPVHHKDHHRSLRDSINDRHTLDEASALAALSENEISHLGAEHKRWWRAGDSSTTFSKPSNSQSSEAFASHPTTPRLPFRDPTASEDVTTSTPLIAAADDFLRADGEPHDRVRTQRPSLRRSAESAGDLLTRASALLTEKTCTELKSELKSRKEADESHSAYEMWRRHLPSTVCHKVVATDCSISHLTMLSLDERRVQLGAVVTKAKMKMISALPGIVKAAQAEAAAKLGLVAKAGPMANKVMDLRGKPACFVTSCLFETGRVSGLDFSVQRTVNSIRQSVDLHQMKIRHLPDTPEVKLFLLLEEPSSSRGALIFSIFMGFCIITSVASLFARSFVDEDPKKVPLGQKQVFKAMESFFTIIFCCEFILRLAVCDALGECTHRQYFARPMVICDMFAIFPFFLEMALGAFDLASDVSVTGILKMARLMRLARVARIARLSRSKKTAIFGPISAVFTVIWGIYLKDT